MSAPNTPTLSVVNDGTGTSATATIGSDAGAINQLFSRLAIAPLCEYPNTT